MTPRITAARLAEIESAAGWEYGNPAIRLVYRELLAELREVTRERDAYKRAKEENDERFMRERDEARAERDEARADYRDHDEYLHNCHKLLKEAGHHVAQGAIDGIHSLINERDKLKQELADLNNDAGNEYAIVMHYKGEMDALRAEVARVRNILKRVAEMGPTQGVKEDGIACAFCDMGGAGYSSRGDGFHDDNCAVKDAQVYLAALNAVKAGTSVCRHSIPTDRKCLDCAALKEK